MAAGDVFVVGVSWRTAPVAIRERLAFRDEEVDAALADLLASPDIDEAVILSTCNRVEIYGSCAARPGVQSAAAEARSFLARSRGVAAEGLASHIYERLDEAAVRHLFRVASALDSMVLGESQILGQLKEAYGAAVRAQATGPILGRSMEKAFQVAKRVRSETGVCRGAANVSSVAVELARKVFGELAGKNVLVIGAGKMSALAARHLRSAGTSGILVTNRSAERASELAAEVEGTAHPWQELDRLLTQADVVLSSTGAEQPILTRKLVKSAMKARRYRPLCIVDVAVPRDAEPEVAKIDGVYLFNIDDLEQVVRDNLAERQKEADAAASLVDGEVAEHRRWLRAQRVTPTIKSLREHFHQVAAAEAERCMRALGSAPSPEQMAEAVRRMSELIANKLLHLPMSALKAGEPGELETLVETTNRLFGLGTADTRSRVGTSSPPRSPPTESEPEGTTSTDKKRSA
jgi:glutamyl-tRNA reductase